MAATSESAPSKALIKAVFAASPAALDCVSALAAADSSSLPHPNREANQPPTEDAADFTPSHVLDAQETMSPTAVEMVSPTLEKVLLNHVATPPSAVNGALISSQACAAQDETAATLPEMSMPSNHPEMVVAAELKVSEMVVHAPLTHEDTLETAALTSMPSNQPLIVEAAELNTDDMSFQQSDTHEETADADALT